MYHDLNKGSVAAATHLFHCMRVDRPATYGSQTVPLGTAVIPG